MDNVEDTKADARPAAERVRDAALVDALAAEFDAVFVINGTTDVIAPVHIGRTYRAAFLREDPVANDLYHRAETECDFYRRVEFVASSFVLEADRESYRRRLSRAYIAETFAKVPSFSFQFQLKSPSEPIHYECRAIRLGGPAEKTDFLICFRCVEAQARHEQAEREEERLHMLASAFKADVSTYLLEHDEHTDVEEFVALRLLNYFGCDYVMLHRSDRTRRVWGRPDQDPPSPTDFCGTCPFRDSDRENDFDASGQARVEQPEDASFELPAACPMRAVLARRVVLDGQIYGKIVVGYKSAPHRFHETDERVLQHATNALALSLQRTRRNRELVEERDRAVAAEKAKSFFFSTVSHDIRTPLNAIIGFSQMLRLGFDDPAERDRAIDSIIVSGKTLLQLINDVLDLSKLEAGRMEILPDPVNCSRLVDEIVESFRASNTKKAVEVRGKVAPMPILLLDPQRVRQILFNLVGNAMKFTQKGYVEVRASYVPGPNEATGGTLSFEIQDTGCGISEADQKKIASPYVQVGRMGRHGGTGLGLAICRQLVSAMDGEIELASAPGEGTTFYVTLTGVKLGEKVARERLSATQQMKVVVPVTPPKTIRRVLLADDSKINLSVIRAMISRIGLRDVVTASNGVEALEILRKDPAINFVLTDMWMPEMDGQALVAEIRKNPAWAKLPVYAVTADVEARNLGESSGFTGVLLKPITFEKLKSLFV